MTQIDYEDQSEYPLNVIFASYGNDSIALIQWAYEQGLQNVFVLYSDTKWAAWWWDERVRVAEKWVKSLGFTPVRTDSEGLENLVRRKKGWPRQGLQFCTYELKILPAQEWLDINDPLGISVCLVGVRREESRARKDFPEYNPRSESHGGRRCWAPLVSLLNEQRDELIKRAGYKPLPHRSMECFPCINSNRRDLRELAKDPPRIDAIEKIEIDMGYTSKGKPRTMFRPYRHMGATGIREIVRWAESRKGEFDPDDGTGGCESGFCGM